MIILNDEAYDIVSRGYCMTRRFLFCSIYTIFEKRKMCNGVFLRFPHVSCRQFSEGGERERESWESPKHRWKQGVLFSSVGDSA